MSKRNEQSRAEVLAFLGSGKTREEVRKALGDRGVFTLCRLVKLGLAENIGGGRGQVGVFVDVRTENRVDTRQPVVRAGMRIGNLEAVREVGTIKSRAVWLFRCSCGGERLARSSIVSLQSPTSCGCQRGRPMGADLLELAAEQGITLAAGRPYVPVQKVNADPKPKPQRIRAKKAKAAGPADNRPAWRPRSEYGVLSEPAKPAAVATICPAPRAYHRWSVDPSEVTPLFSAMKPGQYLEVAA